MKMNTNEGTMNTNEVSSFPKLGKGDHASGMVEESAIRAYTERTRHPANRAHTLFRRLRRHMDPSPQCLGWFPARRSAMCGERDPLRGKEVRSPLCGLLAALAVIFAMAQTGCASKEAEQKPEKAQGPDENAINGIVAVAAFAEAANAEENADIAERSQGISENREIGILNFIDPEQKNAVAKLDVYEPLPKGALLVARTIDLTPTALLRVETMSRNSVGMTILRGSPSEGDLLVIPGPALKSYAESLPEY